MSELPLIIVLDMTSNSARGYLRSSMFFVFRYATFEASTSGKEVLYKYVDQAVRKHLS